MLNPFLAGYPSILGSFYPQILRKRQSYLLKKIMNTFYWHDYETWGINPVVDRPAQFAGVRTDIDLNVIEEPLVLYCQPPPDLLPQPEACMITGITPQYAYDHGIPEYQFAAGIHKELSRQGTCGVGYNSVRFDDHVTRHLLYRNFYDPYEREWKDGNSRWDIIDLVRVCYALRPEGIEWPINENGKPSFKLEDIAEANDLCHNQSHDALSDVYATIAVARMIKTKQPKLFDYVYALRKKEEVTKQINFSERKPILHISAMFPAERGCSALMLPLARHPLNWEKEFICYDLSVDPAPLIESNVEEIKRRIFTPKDDLDVERIPLKTIRINHCPVVCSDNLLTDVIAKRLQIDRSVCKINHDKLLAVGGEISKKLSDVYASPEKAKVVDPEQMLYSGGFFENNCDKINMRRVRNAEIINLTENNFHFEDMRLQKLLFRYRARNFPEILTDDERQEWYQFCYRRLTDPNFGASIVVDEYQNILSDMKTVDQQNEGRNEILDQLSRYMHSLLRQTNWV